MVGFTGYVYSPFAEQKSVSVVDLASEVPTLFHRSRNITGSKHEDPEPLSCC